MSMAALIAAPAWLAWFIYAERSKSAHANASLAELVLVGGFLGDHAVANIGVASMALYLAAQLVAREMVRGARLRLGRMLDSDYASGGTRAAAVAGSRPGRLGGRGDRPVGRGGLHGGVGECARACVGAAARPGTNLIGGHNGASRVSRRGRTVTGSKYLLEADGRHVMDRLRTVSGTRRLQKRNWQRLPFPPKQVDALVLSHAHIDHVGYLPRFVRDGFRRPVYSTPATESLSELLLLDSAHNQEDDADYANRKGWLKHKPAPPLFDAADVKQAMTRFRTVRRGEWFSPAEPIWVRFHDTGHLLGSCMMEVEVRVGSTRCGLCFPATSAATWPFYFDPSRRLTCDYLICESTYGDRDHPPENVLDQLCDVVAAAIGRGGVMLMASFAVGRAQQLIYLLQILMDQRRIPRIPIFLDSPMAVSGMNIYRYYASEHDLTEGLAIRDDFEFNLDHVELVRSVNESRRLNSFKGPGVIISSAGMMTGGRILHHLRQRLPDSAQYDRPGRFHGRRDPGPGAARRRQKSTRVRRRRAGPRGRRGSVRAERPRRPIGTPPLAPTATASAASVSHAWRTGQRQLAGRHVAPRPRMERGSAQNGRDVRVDLPGKDPGASLSQRGGCMNESENIKAILNSPSYVLAEKDVALLARRELRPVRLQLELLKPEMAFVERDIASTIVVFGSTRITGAAPWKSACGLPARRWRTSRAILAVLVKWRDPSACWPKRIITRRPGSSRPWFPADRKGTAARTSS